MDTQLKKGLLDVCVLSALADGESYGYKIISDLKGMIDISESTLYPILRRLENTGALETFTRQHGGRLRRYYLLTAVGRERLMAYKKDLEAIISIYKKLFEGAK